MARQPGGREAAPEPLALVQDFVNTNNIEDEVELLATPEQLRRWLAGRKLLRLRDPVDEAALARAVAVREALRALLVANAGGTVDADALAVLRRAADSARLTVRFPPAGDPEIVAGAPGVDGALGRILVVVVECAHRGTWHRLKACHEHGCRWAFYDHSPNARGTWCSMSICGARNKMRAYRARQRSK